MLLSLDVGFSATGYTVWRSGRVVACGVVRTQKTKAKGVLVSSDTAARCCVLASGLQDLFSRFEIGGVIGELPGGGSQNARAAHQFGLAMGATITCCHMAGLPAEWVTPQAVKRAMTGKLEASKTEIMDLAIDMLGGEKEVGPVEVRKITKGRLKGRTIKSQSVIFHWAECKFAKSDFEHIADSVGVYRAAMAQGNLVKMFG